MDTLNLNIMDALDLLDELNEELRHELISSLIEMLTQYSQKVFFDWQPKVDISKFTDFSEYLQAENNLLQSCFAAEMSPFGDMVRETLGQSPLRDTTKVIFLS